jgi:hypothetical protein
MKYVPALTAGAYTTTLYVGERNTVKKGGRASPMHPHKPGLIFPSWWNVRQKSAVATLCTLWRQNVAPSTAPPWFLVLFAYTDRYSLGRPMDEGTKKTPIPKCRLYWCFCLGWCSNFVGSESGQKQSVKLLQNMVYNTTQHLTPPPPSHTLSVYSLLWEGGRDGGG